MAERTPAAASGLFSPQGRRTPAADPAGPSWAVSRLRSPRAPPRPSGGRARVTPRLYARQLSNTIAGALGILWGRGSFALYGLRLPGQRAAYISRLAAAATRQASSRISHQRHGKYFPTILAEHDVLSYRTFPKERTPQLALTKPPERCTEVAMRAGMWQESAEAYDWRRYILAPLLLCCSSSHTGTGDTELFAGRWDSTFGVLYLSSRAARSSGRPATAAVGATSQVTSLAVFCASSGRTNSGRSGLGRVPAWARRHRAGGRLGQIRDADRVAVGMRRCSGGHGSAKFGVSAALGVSVDEEQVAPARRPDSACSSPRAKPSFSPNRVKSRAGSPPGEPLRRTWSPTAPRSSMS